MVRGPVMGSKPLLRRRNSFTCLGLVFNTALLQHALGPEGQRGRGWGGIWGLGLSFTSKNLTLCPDGTKSGLQLMGTRLSSKGHLARISHTLTHTHTHTYPIPDTHMQTGLVLDLLTLFVQCGMSESLSLLVIYTLLCHV